MYRLAFLLLISFTTSAESLNLDDLSDEYILTKVRLVDEKPQFGIDTVLFREQGEYYAPIEDLRRLKIDLSKEKIETTTQCGKCLKIGDLGTVLFDKYSLEITIEPRNDIKLPQYFSYSTEPKSKKINHSSETSAYFLNYYATLNSNNHQGANIKFFTGQKYGLLSIESEIKNNDFLLREASISWDLENLNSQLTFGHLKNKFTKSDKPSIGLSIKTHDQLLNLKTLYNRHNYTFEVDGPGVMTVKFGDEIITASDYQAGRVVLDGLNSNYDGRYVVEFTKYDGTTKVFVLRNGRFNTLLKPLRTRYEFSIFNKNGYPSSELNFNLGLPFSINANTRSQFDKNDHDINFELIHINSLGTFTYEFTDNNELLKHLISFNRSAPGYNVKFRYSPHTKTKTRNIVGVKTVDIDLTLKHSSPYEWLSNLTTNYNIYQIDQNEIGYKFEVNHKLDKINANWKISYFQDELYGGLNLNIPLGRWNVSANSTKSNWSLNTFYKNDGFSFNTTSTKTTNTYNSTLRTSYTTDSFFVSNNFNLTTKTAETNLSGSLSLIDNSFRFSRFSPTSLVKIKQKDLDDPDVQVLFNGERHNIGNGLILPVSAYKTGRIEYSLQNDESLRVIDKIDETYSIKKGYGAVYDINVLGAGILLQSNKLDPDQITINNKEYSVIPGAGSFLTDLEKGTYEVDATYGNRICSMKIEITDDYQIKDLCRPIESKIEINFDKNEANLSLNELTKLLEWANAHEVKEQKKPVFALETNADSDGTETYNKLLTDRRAATIRDHLLLNNKNALILIKSEGENNAGGDTTSQARKAFLTIDTNN
ncbi:OmpA family protein [Photobacterium leiognathi]|uniref:hypothetical protein n=1 Tax=Photobacterium leiognathi TaxID=553611 RepID=UPI00298158BF|nr:hypothetical protein [Photobacterium leiognathi]